MNNIYNAIQNLYNMDKTTWQEVLAELYNLVSKIDNKFDLFELKFGSLLGEQVTKEIKKMYDNGSLASLINDRLLKDINKKVDTVKTEVSEQLGTKAMQSDLIKTNDNVVRLEMTKATKVEVDVERSRIDNLLALPENSSINNARLEDICIGDDGKTYSTPGKAVREQIKPYNDSIEVVRNILPKMIDGYYWEQTTPPNKVANSGYKYAEPIPVIGGEYYCMNMTVSGGTFSFFADVNKVPIATIESCRDFNYDGYVYKTPVNAKYMYISGIPAGADRVVIKGTYNTTSTGLNLNSTSFPYGSILELKVKKDFFLKSGKNVENYLQNHNDRLDYIENVKKTTYDKIIDEVDSTRIIASNSNLSQLNSTITTSGNITTVTVNTQYGGACVYPFFISNSDSVAIKSKGKATNIEGLDVLIQYKTSSNITKALPSTPLTITSSGDFTIDLTFDATNLIVYQDAVSFSVLIRVLDTSPNGSFTLTDFKVFNTTNFEKNVMYDEDFKTMMGKVFAKIEEGSLESVSEVETIKIAPNGNKYVLQVNNSGNIISIPTIPRKTLFVGNSLVFGMGYGEPSWGMCASQSSKDFRNLVQAKILEKNQSATFSRVHGAQLEQLEDNDVNTLWSTTLNSFTNRPMSESFTIDLDLIIIQLGDNVSTDNRALKFKDNIIEFLKLVRNACPNARILWVDGWFNYDKSHNSIINACKKYGIKNIDIHTLNTIENQGYEGQLYLGSNGEWKPVQTAWITHPGDNGMQEIANVILENMNM